jgi:hypothetical protein
MYSKDNEIEAIVEDLIENNIVDIIASSLDSPKECEVAIELLIEKLEEFDLSVFKTWFD